MAAARPARRTARDKGERWGRGATCAMPRRRWLWFMSTAAKVRRCEGTSTLSRMLSADRSAAAKARAWGRRALFAPAERRLAAAVAFSVSCRGMAAKRKRVAVRLLFPAKPADGWCFAPAKGQESCARFLGRTISGVAKATFRVAGNFLKKGIEDGGVVRARSKNKG